MLDVASMSMMTWNMIRWCRGASNYSWTHKSGSLVLPRRVGALPGTRPFLARRRNSYHLSLGNENRTWRRHMKASEQNSHCAFHRNSINFNHLETVSGRSPGHLRLWVLRSELAGVAGLAQTNRSGKVFVVFDGHKRLVAPELAFSHLEVRLIPGSLAMNSPMHQHTQDIKLEPACTETLACPYSLVAGSFLSILPTSSSSSTSTKSSLSMKLISTGRKGLQSLRESETFDGKYEEWSRHVNVIKEILV